MEINPHIIALRNEFMVPSDNERFQVIRGDGAVFVRDCPTPMDVLLLDGYDHNGLPAKLSSQSFYNQCRTAMTPDGILVVNLQCSHRDYYIHLERIRRAFNSEILIVVDDDLSNAVVIACKGPDLHSQRVGEIQKPKGLTDVVGKELMKSFSSITAALKERDVAHDPMLRRYRMPSAG